MTVKLEGLDQLKKKIAECDKSTKKHLSDMLKKLANHGADVARKELEGGLEMAKESIVVEHVSATEKRIKSLMPEHRARSIEEGRKAGEEIPMMQIARWHLGNRHFTSRRWDELEWRQKEEIMVVHSSVMSSAVPGKNYMQKAADEVTKAAPKEVSAVAHGIERDMKGAV